MNLENITISLDLAKRLKELGVDKPSFINWYVNKGAPDLDIFYDIEEFSFKKYDPKVYLKYPAYIAEELLEILPKDIEQDNNHGGYDLLYLFITRCAGEYYVWYAEANNAYQALHISQQWDIRLCDALAKMLIHLIENKLIDLKDNG